MSYRDDTEAAHARIAALEEELARARAELAALKGDQKHALVVASATAMQHVPRQRAAARWLGAPTVLVNNAVAHVVDEGDGPVADVSSRVWAATLDVDLLAPARLMAACIPHMSARGSGSIVNVSSRAASHGTPRHAAYSAAKGALEALTRSVAVDYATAGIRCNALRPGYIVHEHRDAALLAGDDEARRAALADAQLTRLTTADDVAAACLFLASAESGSITGFVLPVDGGSTTARAKVLG